MFGLRKKIRDLQNRPYAVRVRILKISAAITLVILILLWLLTIQFRHFETSNQQWKKIFSIFKNFQQLTEEKTTP